MIKRITTGWLLLATAMAHANPLPEDFAYGYSIDTPEAAAIYELALPEAVYSGVVRDDLGDVAVFNAAGETVPHAFRRAIQPVPVTPDPVMLPLFPLYQSQPDIPQQLSLKLQSDFHGTLVELDAGRVNTNDAVVAYVLDTGTLEEPIERLVLDWNSPQDNLITHVNVQTSDDLSHWRTLTSAAALAQLDYAGNRLAQNHIELGAKQEKYLKISWPAGVKGATLIAVRGEFAARDGAHQGLRNTYTGRQADTPQSTGFEYEVAGYFPIEEVNLELTLANSLLQGAIYSRSKPEQRWRLRYRGLFYRLEFPQAELTNSMITLSATSDRYWRVEYDKTRSSLGSDIPALQVGWKPHRLVFLARGDSPFTLAYGSARTQAKQAPVISLLDDIRKAMDTLPVKSAQLGPAITGSPDKLLPAPPPLPWKTWLLWASLLTGVLVLGILAWRLQRQIKGVGDK